jgi:hypothetical protein
MMGINNNPYYGVNRFGLLSPLKQINLTKSVVIGVFQSKSLDIYYIFFSKKAKSGYNWLCANISENRLYLISESISDSEIFGICTANLDLYCKFDRFNF